jgi:hypothetical protein
MTVTRRTELLISADRACQLAQKPALLAHIVKPWLAVSPEKPPPEVISEGELIRVQIRILGVRLPWTHTLRIERLGAREIRSCESGGPIKRWDHRLTFEPTSPTSCRYTDAIEIDAGAITPAVAAFAHLFYRYRHARWRALARVLA